MAAASLSTSTFSISEGSIPAKSRRLIPSTTYTGGIPCSTPSPRTWIVGVIPGAPGEDTTSTPASRPTSSSATFVTTGCGITSVSCTSWACRGCIRKSGVSRIRASPKNGLLFIASLLW